MKRIIKKFQIPFFFIITTLFGYLPWIVTRKPIWNIWGMSLAGFLIVFYLKGIKGIKDILNRVIPRRSDLKYYVIIPVFFICCYLFAIFISYLIYNDIPTFKMIREEPFTIPLLILIVLVGGPLAEELFGLRGYALPQVMKRTTPLLASVIVGFYFGAWHFIEFNDPGSSQYAIGITMFPFFIIIEIAFSIIMTFIYQRSTSPLFTGGVYFHLNMDVFACLLMSDITLSSINNVPVLNKHYFVVFGVIVISIALAITICTKGLRTSTTTAPTQ